LEIAAAGVGGGFGRDAGEIKVSDLYTRGPDATSSRPPQVIAKAQNPLERDDEIVIRVPETFILPVSVKV